MNHMETRKESKAYPGAIVEWVQVQPDRRSACPNLAPSHSPYEPSTWTQCPVQHTCDMLIKMGHIDTDDIIVLPDKQRKQRIKLHI